MAKSTKRKNNGTMKNKCPILRERDGTTGRTFHELKLVESVNDILNNRYCDFALRRDSCVDAI